VMHGGELRLSAKEIDEIEAFSSAVAKAKAAL